MALGLKRGHNNILQLRVDPEIVAVEDRCYLMYPINFAENLQDVIGQPVDGNVPTR